MSKFSETLDNLMKARDMSNEKLADLVGVNRTTISRWRSGSRSPKMEKLSELAAIFKVLPQDFVEGDSNYSDINYYYDMLDGSRKTKAFEYTKKLYMEQNASSDKIVTFPRSVKIYASVSAGTGEWLEYENIEEVEYDGDLPDYDYAVRVNGDSMQPMFEDDDIVFVKKQDYLSNGAIMIIVVDNEAYIKKVRVDGGQLRLVSLNPKYDDILVSHFSDVRIIGKVIFA